MICAFCEKHVDSTEEAILENWIPTFWANEIEYEGPVCPHCEEKFLDVNDWNWSLKPNLPLPVLAIPFKAVPENFFLS